MPVLGKTDKIMNFNESDIRVSLATRYFCIMFPDARDRLPRKRLHPRRRQSMKPQVEVKSMKIDPPPIALEPPPLRPLILVDLMHFVQMHQRILAKFLMWFVVV